MNDDPIKRTLDYGGPSLYSSKHRKRLLWLGIASFCLAAIQIPWLFYLGWVVGYGWGDGHSSTSIWYLFAYFFPSMLAVVTGVFPAFAPSGPLLGRIFGILGFLGGCAWCVSLLVS